VLVVGQPSAPRSSPDHLALEAVNSVLGGSFTSRLNQNLREQHGYTYGAASRFAFGLGPGPFAARSSVKTDVTGPALAETLKEIEAAVAQPVAPAELDKARALLAYDLVERLSGADALSRGVAEIFLYGLPPDELQTYVPRLQALTPESVQAAAARAVDPAHLTIAIAGDAAKVLPQLAPLHLPAPQLRDPSGELSATATASKPAPR
jgi:zinc protease